MINLMPHRRFFLILAGFLYLATPTSWCIDRTISFDDVASQRRTENQEGYILYDKLFQGQKTQALSQKEIPQEALGSSWTSQIREFESDERGKSARVSRAWSNLSSYVKKNFKNALIPSGEASFYTGEPLPLIPKPLPVNRIAPKISFGRDYIEPTLSIENSFNSEIQTEVSFHSRDKNLEAELSRKLSKDVELTLINNNVFTQNLEKKVVLGFKYRF